MRTPALLVLLSLVRPRAGPAPRHPAATKKPSCSVEGVGDRGQEPLRPRLHGAAARATTRSSGSTAARARSASACCWPTSHRRRLRHVGGRSPRSTLNGRFVAWQCTCRRTSRARRTARRATTRSPSRSGVVDVRTRKRRAVRRRLGRGQALVVTRTGTPAWLEDGWPAPSRSRAGATRARHGCDRARWR